MTQRYCEFWACTLDRSAVFKGSSCLANTVRYRHSLSYFPCFLRTK
jgi:hypothetical protein